MALFPCAPCDCIPANIPIDTFKQDVEVILCSLLGALSETLNVAVVAGTPATFQTSATTTGATGATAPEPSATRYTVQVGAIGGTAVSWSVDLEASFDSGVTYGTVLTHTLAGDGNFGFESVDLIGATNIRFNVTALDLGTATSIQLIAKSV